MTESLQRWPNASIFADAESIQEFLNQPLPTIAAAITGILSSDRADFVGASGQILQAALKGRAYQQFGREVDEFVKKGKIKPNYAESAVGFKSLLDVVQFIDSENPDDDRLSARSKSDVSFRERPERTRGPASSQL